MAVVQISKIQLRRGQKNSQSGIPQLSSAEMAWAVDTQELFIGNGSVAEGAPFVGNTKILTERDNILELAASYEFSAQELSITQTVPRTLQDKLDEIQVSVKDFGAISDGVTNNVNAFENAFADLFLNTNDKYKKVLIVPNGVYAFSADLKIPSNVIIRGETQLGVVLKFNNRNIRFVTPDGLELLSEFTSANRPRNVEISNLTIERTTGSVTISGLADSIFKEVVFKGSFELGDAVASIASETPAVFWTNENAGTRVDNVLFDNCTFEANSVNVTLRQTSVIDNSVTFRNTVFFVSFAGVYLETAPGTKNEWHFDNCEFREIETVAVKSLNGTDTLLLRCKFKNCGNGSNTADFPQTPIVEFGERRGNLLVDCISDRQQSAGVTNITDGTVAITEVLNGDRTTFINRNHAGIELSDNFLPLAVFSAKNNYFIINYFLKLGLYSRTGQLMISINEDFSHAGITDYYQYSTQSINDPGGRIMTNFEFNVSLLDNDDNGEIDTLLLSYRNNLSSANDSTIDGLTGSISFDVTYGV